MAANWIETITGSLEQKKQYRQYKARIEALPEPYGTAAKAPVRAIVGDDPVEFAETFAQAYSGKQWIDKERERLTKTIDSLAGDDDGKGVDS
jgi:DNA-binding ferritin-like protein (Dps family)